MDEHLVNPVGGCACDPFPASADQGCQGCSPNMILTCEEEAIFRKFSRNQEQVAPITNKLSNIQKEIGRVNRRIWSGRSGIGLARA